MTYPPDVPFIDPYDPDSGHYNPPAPGPGQPTYPLPPGFDPGNMPWDEPPQPPPPSPPVRPNPPTPPTPPMPNPFLPVQPAPTPAPSPAGGIDWSKIWPMLIFGPLGLLIPGLIPAGIIGTGGSIMNNTGLLDMLIMLKPGNLMPYMMYLMTRGLWKDNPLLMMIMPGAKRIMGLIMEDAGMLQPPMGRMLTLMGGGRGGLFGGGGRGGGMNTLLMLMMFGGLTGGTANTMMKGGRIVPLQFGGNAVTAEPTSAIAGTLTQMLPLIMLMGGNLTSSGGLFSGSLFGGGGRRRRRRYTSRRRTWRVRARRSWRR